jgi:outer membrane receptor protein involved in Fe transport
LVNLYYSKSFNERVTVGIYVKNIFDKVYPTRGFIFVLEPPTYEEKLYKSYGPPTEFGASLTYSF